MLRPLSPDEVVTGATRALGVEFDQPRLLEAALQAEGSIGRALTLLNGPALELRRQVVAQLDRLPALDPRALHALGETLGGSEPQRLEAFVDAVNAWLSARSAGEPEDKLRLVRLADAWDKVNKAARDADTYNLDRKPLVFSVFGWLAEAAAR
jgi:DNA polymerase-3 subunit delta'